MQPHLTNGFGFEVPHQQLGPSPDCEVKSECTEAVFAPVSTLRSAESIPWNPERDKWKRKGAKPGLFICPDCGTALSRADALTRHRKRRHKAGQRYFCHQPNCPQSNPSFDYPGEYKFHLQLFHGIVQDVGASRPPKRPRGKAAQSASPPALPTPSSPHPGSHEARAPGPPLTLTQPPRAVPEAARPTGALSAFTNAEDLEKLTRDELLGRLRAKMRECEKLAEDYRVARLERDEYAEALKLSEEMRRRGQWAG
ncbi:hypothetical protein F4780DRAFT_749333 [Xylariomycetidae sp. FL0641]|nr:hypothetical protein F4780DRAFT_749333 [Xylariomycetidae sp. FL0641]